MTITAADLRDMWLEAQTDVAEIAREVIGTFMRPDLETELALRIQAMPPEVLANLDPARIEQMLEVFNA